MLALPDMDDELDNIESDSTSAPEIPLLVPQPSALQYPITRSISHNININYHHCYTVEKKNGEEIDIPTLFQSLAHYTVIQSPSGDIQTTKSIQKKVLSPSKPKTKTLFLTDLKRTITFTALDISDPPHLKYSDDLDNLPIDWEQSSYLKIKGVPIPLKYWAEVYRWAKPEQWSILKDTWTNWKVSASPILMSQLSRVPSFVPT